MVYGGYPSTDVDGVNRMLDAGVINPRAARDAVRCILTEQRSGMKVFTIDKKGEVLTTRDVNKARPHQHICGDLNNLACNEGISLRSRNGYARCLLPMKGRVEEVYLDYCWSQAAYWESHLSPTFYTDSLPWLARLLSERGKILLPLHNYVFLRLMKYATPLARYVSIGFLTHQQSQHLNLVSATDSIDREDWETRYRKTINQQSQQLSDNRWETFLRQLMDETYLSPQREQIVRAYRTMRHSSGDCFIELERLSSLEFDVPRTEYILKNGDSNPPGT